MLILNTAIFLFGPVDKERAEYTEKKRYKIRQQEPTDTMS